MDGHQIMTSSPPAEQPNIDLGINYNEVMDVIKSQVNHTPQPNPLDLQAAPPYKM